MAGTICQFIPHPDELLTVKGFAVGDVHAVLEGGEIADMKTIAALTLSP